MGQYCIEFTLQAREHLNGIYKYIKNELSAPIAARRIVTLIKEEITSLTRSPERVQLIREEPWFSLGVRRDRVKNYYIYFIVDDVDKIVHVADIIYARRDQTRQLKELDIK